MNNQTKQRYISTSIWSDDWFDSLSEREKLVYFYLLTNEHTNVAGVYECTLKNVRLEIGLVREEIERIMAKFAEAGKAYYYEGYIIIPRWMKHQKFEERKKLYFAAKAVLVSLPPKIKKFIIDKKDEFNFEFYKGFQACLEDIVEDEVITTLELSKKLGLSRSQTLRLAAEILEDKIVNGKATLWTEQEMELIREYYNDCRRGDTELFPESCEGHAKVSRPSHESCEGQEKKCEGHAKAKGDSDSDSDSDLDLDSDKNIHKKNFETVETIFEDPLPENGRPSPETLSSHFIWRWQRSADVFNCLARLKRPSDWKAFWEQNTLTLEQIDLALDNFIKGVKSGAIERRYIPGSPDGFVLKGWLTRSFDQFRKQGQRIANDSAAVDNIDQYFREA